MKKLIMFIFLISNLSIHSSTFISFNELPKHYSEQSDESVLFDFIEKTNKVVIVKCYADWCAPCRRMMPILKRVAEHFNDRLIIISINIDVYKKLCNQLNIHYLPTFIYFKDGSERQRTNSVNQNTMVRIIESLLL